jgi:dolichyl-phosphate beta-glucosyltransferase
MAVVTAESTVSRNMAEPVPAEDMHPLPESPDHRLDAEVSHVGSDIYARYLVWKNQPLTAAPKLSIAIPAYNESERIVPTIGAIAAYVCSLDIPWELIVADDGSKDDTVPLCQELNLANLHVLIAEKNGGKGSAVRRGMLASHGAVVLFADADNSTPIEELGPMLQKIEDGCDVVIGSRAASGAQEAHRSWLRQTMSATLRGMIRPIFNLQVSDTQCGFKLFRGEVAQRLFRAQTIMGFSFDLEILYLANKWGYKIAEQPVTWVDAPGSKVDSAKEVKRFLKDMWRIKRNDWQGIYADQ